MSRTRITIEKLQAATDTGHIEKAIESVPGVSSVAIDIASKTAIVEHEGADVERMTRAIGQLGYAASIDP